MNPLLFAGALAVLSMAMVVAMVRDWRLAYALLWIAIAALLFAFTRQPWVLLVPFGWLAIQLLIMRFAAALRDRPPLPSRAMPVVGDEGDEEDEETALEPEPEYPLRWRLIRAAMSLLRWLAALATAMIVIVVGENLPFLRRLDVVLAPHLRPLQIALGIALAAGFALFMGGIIHLLLTSTDSRDGEFTLGEVRRQWRDGTWRDTARMRRFFVIAGGAALAITAGMSLVIVSAPPGIKLIAILALVYPTVRILAARDVPG